GVSASRLRDGTLPPKYLSRVEAAARRMELMRPFWLSTDSLASCTVSGLAAKAKKLRPDILFVDGMYLMQDDLGEPPNSTLGLAHISRDLKRLAQNLNIPVVGTHQILESKQVNGRSQLSSL